MRQQGGPVAVVDLAVAERNAELMAKSTRELGVSLRPHVKVHKCPELAQVQLRHGAIGVTVATAAEAVAMVEGGVEDVLVANQVVDPDGLAALAGAARRAKVALSVDDPRQVALAGQAAAAAGSTLHALIEVDVGMGRCGVREIERVVPLARTVEAEPNLSFGGIAGYEGHCVDEPDRALRERGVTAAAERLRGAVLALVADGLTVDVVSAGGTGTYDLAGAEREITELQAGSYLLMDNYHAAITPEFEFALTVHATVIARHGDLIVLDAGRKAVSSDLAPIHLPDHEAEFCFSHEEHSGFRLRGDGPEIADRVRIVPGYAPSTVNLHGSIRLVEGEALVESCRVRARHGDL
ncbi:MAG TPA: alanine racemase [Solirubrobacterales bacterium]|nr:alanine racemase [Solirubrobacterales bacterium]